MTELHVSGFAGLDTTTLYEILRLRAEVFVIEQECVYLDVDGRDCETGTRHIWITDGEPAPLAYLRILAEPDGAARIGRVVVSPKARRQGLAGMLLAHALEVIGNRDAVLDAQTYATDLYARAGFQPEGSEFLEDGIPHITMRRPASP